MNPISSFLLVLFLYISTAESANPVYHICNDNSKTYDGSQISRNIDYLLPRLVYITVQYGFFGAYYGGGNDRIYGLAQCRGDVGRAYCYACLQDAAKEIRSRCPNQADAKIWYDYCFLRYSTVKFFGELDTTGAYLYNVQDVTDPDAFNAKLGALMDQISSQAVKLGSKGLGKGKSDISSFTRLYALVQCTRDLSQINCAQCLADAIGKFPVYCNNKRGCQVLYCSCYVRYELYPFFFPLDPQESLNHSLDDEKYKTVVALKV